MNWKEFLSGELFREMWMDSPNKNQITVATISATSSISLAGLIDLFQGPLAFCGIVAGLIATLILARANWLLGEQRELEILLLKRRVQGLAEDPNVEKRHDV